MEQTIEINKVIMGGLGLGRAADGMAVMVAGAWLACRPGYREERW